MGREWKEHNRPQDKACEKKWEGSTRKRKNRESFQTTTKAWRKRGKRSGLIQYDTGHGSLSCWARGNNVIRRRKPGHTHAVQERQLSVLWQVGHLLNSTKVYLDMCNTRTAPNNELWSKVSIHYKEHVHHGILQFPVISTALMPLWWMSGTQTTLSQKHSWSFV